MQHAEKEYLAACAPPVLGGLARRLDTGTMDASVQQPATFLFCFHLPESMRLLGCLQALSAVYWVYALILADNDPWQTAHPLRITSIALLVLNAVLVHAAVQAGSERSALALVLSFGLTLILLAITFGGSHPASCSDADTIDDTPLGTRQRPDAMCRIPIALSLQRSTLTTCLLACFDMPAQARSSRTCSGRLTRAC